MSTIAEGTAPEHSAPADDRALPFQVEALDVRGRAVTLGPAINAILERHEYPPPVNHLLGEAMALAALLATSLKDTGRFILQAQTDGPVRLIVVDIRTPGEMRATASFDLDAVEAATAEAGGAPGQAALLGKGTLAMTVEQGGRAQRYQGYVPIDGEGLEAAAHTYFRQSEQIPTRIRLATAEVFSRDADGAARQSWRAGGVIAQFMPDASDRIRHRDLPPGDIPDDASDEDEFEIAPDDDAWTEAAALIDTVEDHELTDPEISAERLLFRLFHERGVRVFDPVALMDKCSCSKERIMSVLEQLQPDEVAAATVDGNIEVRCEFCGTLYQIDPDEIRHDETPDAA